MGKLAKYLAALDGIDAMLPMGEVVEIAGLLVESNGPVAGIGDFCEIRTAGGRAVRTQVVGFRNGRVLSMPLEEIGGLELGDPVVARRGAGRVPVGPGLCWMPLAVLSTGGP